MEERRCEPERPRLQSSVFFFRFRFTSRDSSLASFTGASRSLLRAGMRQFELHEKLSFFFVTQVRELLMALGRSEIQTKDSKVTVWGSAE